MSAAENKQLLQHIFDELAQGNSRPLVESMADDFCWTVTGSTRWSKTYEGKQAVIGELFGTLRSRMADRIRTKAERFIAEDDLVVIEARGNNTTKNGKLQEVTEYMDTLLVATALE